MKKIDITPQEVIKHLVNTGPLWDKKRYKAEFKSDGTFMITAPDGERETVSSARLLSNKDWYTKPHWTDNLSEENPVLCWVWDSGTRDYAVIRMICRFDSILTSYKFEDLEAESWVNAEPVKLSEACIWEDGNVN